MSRARLMMICLVAAMGGLLFGYDWVVIGGAKPFYEPFFGLDDPSKAWEAGFAMSSAVLGCIGGAVGLGWLPDRFGRKPSLILSAVLFTVSAIWTAFAGGYASFVAARILGGLGIGLASNVSPVYIAEVSPPESRGRLVSVNQLTIVLGIIFAQLANYIVFRTAPSDISWRIMFGAEAVPAALFLVLAFFIPESPRWRATQVELAPRPLANATLGERASCPFITGTTDILSVAFNGRDARCPRISRHNPIRIPSRFRHLRIDGKAHQPLGHLLADDLPIVLRELGARLVKRVRRTDLETDLVGCREDRTPARHLPHAGIRPSRQGGGRQHMDDFFLHATTTQSDA